MSTKLPFFARCKRFFTQLIRGPKVSLESNCDNVDARMDRLERNYIVLLKRVLEIDGIQLGLKSSSFTNKIMSTPHDELHKGLNEPEPTIH